MYSYIQTKEKNYAFLETVYYDSLSFTSKTSVNSTNRKENLRFFEMYFVQLSTNQGEKLHFFGET